MFPAEDIFIKVVKVLVVNWLTLIIAQVFFLTTLAQDKTVKEIIRQIAVIREIILNLEPLFSKLVILCSPLYPCASKSLSITFFFTLTSLLLIFESTYPDNPSKSKQYALFVLLIWLCCLIMIVIYRITRALMKHIQGSQKER